VAASHKKGISPIRAVTRAKGRDAEEDEDEDEEEKLSRELDDALEELDVPSSSLPIASSDFDTEPPHTSSSSGGYLTTAEDQEDETMRFWSTGLPPSSPPPPTSPVLQSQTDDEDMDDISNAMSDSDGLTFEQDPQNQQFLAGPSSSSSDYMNSMSFSDDLAMCFDDFNQLFSDPMTGTINTNEEDTSLLLPLPSSDPVVVQNGIADFDFTQFWESVKPLVDQSMTSSSTLPSDGLAGENGMQEDSGGEIDHVKLAEEVHALFSGCLM
jgi:hypothetical protein